MYHPYNHIVNYKLQKTTSFCVFLYFGDTHIVSLSKPGLHLSVCRSAVREPALFRQTAGGRMAARLRKVLYRITAKRTPAE